MHNGTRVAVISETPSGLAFVEGLAVVVEQRRPGVYRVRFPAGYVVERHIDLAAQADPVAYVSGLNGWNPRAT